MSLEYNAVEITPQDIDFYQTKFKPIGTRDGLKIENINTNSILSFCFILNLPLQKVGVKFELFAKPD